MSESKRRISVRMSAALLCAVGMGACGSSQTTSSSGSHTTAAPRAAGLSPTVARCTTSQLRLTYEGMQGATGHLEATFSLHNGSARSCTLQGYPGAQLLDAGGHPLTTHLKRGDGFFPDTLQAPRRVLLTPGAGAQFGLSFAANNEYFRGRRCPVASTLESSPPSARQWLRVSLAGGGRPKFAPCGGQLVASPVYLA